MSGPGGAHDRPCRDCAAMTTWRKLLCYPPSSAPASAGPHALSRQPPSACRTRWTRDPARRPCHGCGRWPAASVAHDVGWIALGARGARRAAGWLELGHGLRRSTSSSPGSTSASACDQPSGQRTSTRSGLDRAVLGTPKRQPGPRSGLSRVAPLGTKRSQSPSASRSMSATPPPLTSTICVAGVRPEVTCSASPAGSATSTNAKRSALAADRSPPDPLELTRPCAAPGPTPAPGATVS